MNAMITIQPLRTAGKKRRRGKPASPAVPSVVTEHGLELRYARGDVAVEHRAPEVDDPNRFVSRAMAVSSVDRLYDRGTISRPEHLAAQKYLELREIETGANNVGGGESVGRLAPWQKGHPAMTQVQASTSLRHVHAVIGPRAKVLVTLLIVDNLSSGQLALRFARLGSTPRHGHPPGPVDDRVVKGWIQAALNRMAEHFGLLEE